jgi:hypothetical protein
MKRTLIASLMSASMLFGFAFAAQAQSSGSVTVKDEADQPVAQMQAADAADENADKISDRSCLRSTGSTITTRYNARAEKDRQKCVSANGRSYTRDDIRETGEVDLADALRKLDPSVR